MLNVKRGFTLVEVLVATVILVLAIATVTGIVNASRLTTLKANRSMQFYSQIPSILADIKLEIRRSNAPDSLTGRHNTPQLEYAWEARSIDTKPPSLGLVDLDSGTSSFRLYEVSILISQGNLSKRYTLHVMAWKNDFN